MKILIYSKSFFPVIGGAHTAVHLLAEGLAAANASTLCEKLGGVEVTIVTNSRADGMDDSRLPYGVLRKPSLLRLIRLIRAADVVHVSGPCLLPLAIGWLTHRPVVIEHYGYQTICPNGLLFMQPSRAVCPGYFMQGSYRQCFRCCSAEMGRTASARYLFLTFPRRWLSKNAAANIAITNHVANRLNLPRTRTIYYGIKAPAPVFGEGPKSGGTFEMAYVGRLVAEKGVPILLEAAQILKERGIAFRLSLIGDGPERGHLERLARRLELRDIVVFKGELKDLELDHAVQKVAAVVMPSLWEETAGLSAIEQMMRGRVVIAADIGGLSEVVGDAGLKFTPGDSRALASCIQSIIDTPSLMESLGSAARQRAERLFRQDNMIRHHLSVYNKVLGAGCFPDLN